MIRSWSATSRRDLLRALWMLPLGGAWRGGPQDVPAFRTSVDVVRLDVLVLDGTRPVAGLTARDFVVTDSGERQTIRVERLADLPLDVVLALDVSSSVAGPLLQQLVAGARTLVTALRPQDRATVVRFSHHVLPLGAFTTSRALLLTTIDRLVADGNTSVIDAVSVALSTADRARPTLVLAFSDGLDTASFLGPQDVLEQARAGEAVVEAVVVGALGPEAVVGRLRADLRHELDEIEGFLSAVTAETGGRVLDGARGGQLGEVFVEVLAAFRERYQISFTPTLDTPGWHPVEVRLPRRRGVTIRARSGYQR